MSRAIPAIPDTVRRLVVICGDQLDTNSSVFDGFDPSTDAVLLTEAFEEATYVWQHKRRLVFFFAAMRGFRDALREQGFPVLYNALDDEDAPRTLADGLTRAIKAHTPDKIILARPGDYRVREALSNAADAAECALTLHEESHFLTTPADFRAFKEGRKRFILEDFYRQIRRQTGYLMDGDKPVGGAWNYDKDNRETFKKEGPGLVPRRETFPPCARTQAVIDMVAERFPDAPGSLDGFAEPVTRADALVALDDFITHRLCDFGSFQDAMWEGASTLYHSRLSAVMNVKLLNPHEVCEAAIAAYEDGRAPLNSVEGFVRQIIGWREFTRGVYWTEMPGYADLNGLNATNDVPAFFWTGDTEMACLRDALTKLLATGYAHHIERLMLMGLYLQLHGTDPFKAHEWHMALYLDAIDWVSMPNMLGMSQHGDEGIVGTKPYCASGAYINRMGHYCKGCRFDPKIAHGENACPFTTLYWDFLARHEDKFASNRRMKLQINNLRRKDETDLREIRKHSKSLIESPR